ncbi:VOC family protein [Roseateles sp.]|uniref:VOC family protein n=1 Tax=Roseateles sp. TaxID=1971397 RepID=UPI003D0C062A
MNHIALRVAALEDYVAFLAAVFGYREHERVVSEEGAFTLVFMTGPEAGSIELIHNWQESVVQPGRTLSHFGFYTGRYDEILRLARDHGAPVLEENLLPGGRRQCYIAAPDGMPIEINDGSFQ